MLEKKQKFLLGSFEPEELGGKNYLFGNGKDGGTFKQKGSEGGGNNGNAGSQPNPDDKHDIEVEAPDFKTSGRKYKIHVSNTNIDVSDIEAENKKLNQAVSDLRSGKDVTVILDKYGASLKGILNPGESAAKAIDVIQAQITGNIELRNKLKSDLKTSMPLEELRTQSAQVTAQIQGDYSKAVEEIRGGYSLQTTGMQTNAQIEQTLQQNVNALKVEAYRNESALFQQKVKPSLERHDRMVAGLDDNTVDRGEFVEENGIYSYLANFKIAKKLTFDATERAALEKAGVKPESILKAQEVIDYTQVKVDKVLLYEREDGANDPRKHIQLYYIPKDVKKAKLDEVKPGITDQEAQQSDFVHNIDPSKAIKVEEEKGTGKYFYLDNNQKVYVDEDDVFAKVATEGSAKIAKSGVKPNVKTGAAPGAYNSGVNAGAGKMVNGQVSYNEEQGEYSQEEDLGSLFHKVKKAKEVLYHSLPPSQQKDFDVTFSFIGDLEKRKLISGIWSKIMDSMGLLGAIVRTVLPSISAKWGHKKNQDVADHHQDNNSQVNSNGQQLGNTYISANQQQNDQQLNKLLEPIADNDKKQLFQSILNDGILNATEKKNIGVSKINAEVGEMLTLVQNSDKLGQDDKKKFVEAMTMITSSGDLNDVNLTSYKDVIKKSLSVVGSNNFNGNNNYVAKV